MADMRALLSREVNTPCLGDEHRLYARLRELLSTNIEEIWRAGTGMIRRTTGGRRAADPSAATITAISEMYEHAECCAESGGPLTVATDEPGIERLRHGRRFSYRQLNGRRITAADVKQRIVAPAGHAGTSQIRLCGDTRVDASSSVDELLDTNFSPEHPVLIATAPVC
jgi:hypothetical protein